MTGSLQIKNNIYYAVLNYKDEFGKRKQKWISTELEVANNKRKAESRLREILVEVEQQKTVYSADILFLDWVDKWMEQKKNEIRLNTYEAYKEIHIKHIIPFYKPLKLTLNTITPQHIQDYYNKKRKSGQSANSIQKHNVIIRGALQDAMKKNLIPYNPADRATLPAKSKFVGKAYTIEQANNLLKAINEEPIIKPAVILGLFYGLRRSEVLGLRWRDIDFEAGTICICNTVVRTKTIIETEQTKSKASNRTLYIIPETRDYLLKIKQNQEKNRMIMKNSYNETDRVCVWNNGEPFKPDYISKTFPKLLRKYNLPRIRFHELRHTAGSLLLAKGLSVKQIQEYLGHEQVSTTLDIYGHLSIEGKKETSNMMGGILKL